jgi:hypothetical protein
MRFVLFAEGQPERGWDLVQAYDRCPALAEMLDALLGLAREAGL